jgi:hypothetical protein
MFPTFFLQYLGSAEYLLTSLSTALKTSLVILNGSVFVLCEYYEDDVRFILHVYVVDGLR